MWLQGGKEEGVECKGVLMGCTGPREPGWDHTWTAVGRVGESKMGTSDAAAEKGREEGVRRVWRTKGTP